MGPLLTMSNEWSYVAALVIGILFGFILEQAGFSSSRKLAGVFYGYDFAVIRVFFSAAGTAAVGILYFDYLGWLDISQIFINSLYLGSTIVGGLIMGLGFVIGGFCPGTSIAAVAIGKVDAWFFVGGTFLGVLLFDLGYPLYKGLVNGYNYGPVKIHETLGMSAEIFISLFALIAVIVFAVTALVQKKVSDPTKTY